MMSDVQMHKKVPHRIGIDFHVVDGLFQGTRTHVLQLFSEIVRISPDIHFVFFLEHTELPGIFSSIFTAANVQIVYMPNINPIVRLCWQLPMLRRKYQLDILHTQYILPIANVSPGIVTIHDILFETFPVYFSPFFRFRSSILIRLSVLRASHIFTVSEFSKQEMVRLYKVAPEKISVIYNGVDTNRFFPGDSGLNIIEKRGLFSKEYLLSVGRLEPRKNYITLIRAYAQLQAKIPLVIIGQRHFRFKEIFKVIQDLGLVDRVRIFSDIEDDDLPAFYRHARLFLYPSWAEGFGMPILEAMASGVPVISSNSTSIPEVAGDAAVLINPGDVDELAFAIDHYLSDSIICNEKQQLGFKQVNKFRWSHAAARVKNVYFSV